MRTVVPNRSVNVLSVIIRLTAPSSSVSVLCFPSSSDIENERACQVPTKGDSLSVAGRRRVVGVQRLAEAAADEQQQHNHRRLPHSWAESRMAISPEQMS